MKSVITIVALALFTVAGTLVCYAFTPQENIKTLQKTFTERTSK